MKLNELAPEQGSRKARKRLGRGVGSGQGKTAGRGTKGQNSRAGGGVRPGFEGGQMPLHRRLPKRGFHNVFRKDIVAVNLRALSGFDEGACVDTAALVAAGIVKKNADGVKLLGHGNIDKALKIQVAMVSKSAKEKVIAAGGSIEE